MSTSPQEELEARLRKSGTDPGQWADAVADMVWLRIKPRIELMIRDRAAAPVKVPTQRDRLLESIIGGLAAKWEFGSSDCTSAQRLAEYAERLTDAVLREESKRSGERQ